LVYVKDKRELPINEKGGLGPTQIQAGPVRFRVALVGGRQPLADGQINVFIAEPEPTVAMINPETDVLWVDAGAGRSLLPGVSFASSDGDISGYLLQTPAPPTGEGLRSLYDFTLNVRPDLSRTTLVITVTGTNVPVVPTRTYALEFK
jgi:hypothetical protein